MAFRLDATDLDTLSLIADFRVLSTRQAAILLQQSDRAVRRRLNQLRDAGLINLEHRSVGKGRGRPEGVITLAAGGSETLQAAGRAVTEVIGPVLQLHALAHDVLVNWVRVHLVLATRAVSRISLKYHRPPCVPTYARSKAHKSNGTAKESEPFDLIPDGVFAITDKTSGKSLLFFLEVDMGTESQTSANRDATTILGKLQAYKELFRSAGYQRYEKILGATFRGFRVLFVAHTYARRVQLSRLVEQVKPSEFIWLTDQDRIFRDGISAEIWSRGGRIDGQPESILGPTLACRAPLALSKE